MKRKKTVKKQASEFNTSSMSKPRKILYNKIIKNYRFSEIYDLRPLNISCQSNSDRRNPITPELKF